MHSVESNLFDDFFAINVSPKIMVVFIKFAKNCTTPLDYVLKMYQKEMIDDNGGWKFHSWMLDTDMVHTYWQANISKYCQYAIDVKSTVGREDLQEFMR